MDHPRTAWPVLPGPYRLARTVWPVPSEWIAAADRSGALQKGETQPRFVIREGHGGHQEDSPACERQSPLVNTMCSVRKAPIEWLGWAGVHDDLVTPVVKSSHL